MRTALLAAALALAACSTPGRYTGDTYYYDAPDGTHWSCREPRPWPGGNCMPDAAWPDGGLSRAH